MGNDLNFLASLWALNDDLIDHAGNIFFSDFSESVIPVGGGLLRNILIVVCIFKRDISASCAANPDIVAFSSELEWRRRCKWVARLEEVERVREHAMDEEQGTLGGRCWHLRGQAEHYQLIACRRGHWVRLPVEINSTYELVTP